MATQVVTIQEIIESVPDLYSTLEEKAKSLKDQKPSDGKLIQKAKEYVEDLFQSAEADISQEDLAASEKELTGIFDRMDGKIQIQRIKAIKGLRELDPKKRKEIIKFWAAVADFLGDVMNWLGLMFNYVLEKFAKDLKL